jgi:hypothetical protein
MLYIKMDVWHNIPAKWDKAQDMHKYLRRMTYGYQLDFETKMFAIPDGEPYRCVLVRWENHGGGNKRDVLLETSDPAQMEAVLLMLISEAEVVEKANKLRSLK